MDDAGRKVWTLSQLVRTIVRGSLKMAHYTLQL